MVGSSRPNWWTCGVDAAKGIVSQVHQREVPKEVPQRGIRQNDLAFYLKVDERQVGMVVAKNDFFLTPAAQPEDNFDGGILETELVTADPNLSSDPHLTELVEEAFHRHMAGGEENRLHDLPAVIDSFAAKDLVSPVDS